MKKTIKEKLGNDVLDSRAEFPEGYGRIKLHGSWEGPTYKNMPEEALMIGESFIDRCFSVFFNYNGVERKTPDFSYLSAEDKELLEYLGEWEVYTFGSYWGLLFKFSKKHKTRIITRNEISKGGYIENNTCVEKI